MPSFSAQFLIWWRSMVLAEPHQLSPWTPGASHFGRIGCLIRHYQKLESCINSLGACVRYHRSCEINKCPEKVIHRGTTEISEHSFGTALHCFHTPVSPSVIDNHLSSVLHPNSASRPGQVSLSLAEWRGYCTVLEGCVFSPHSLMV